LFGNIFTTKNNESLALSLNSLLDAPIIELDTIDSTNNYAMHLVDADTAQPGMTIIANRQTQGKGQRGKEWKDSPGESLLVSMVVTPECSVDQQFVFNSAVATAIAEVLCDLYEGWHIKIKWPNDIIINDKKAGGILIENILRGNSWTHSIIGIGLNLYQTSFPADLPYATSLLMASGQRFSGQLIFEKIREAVFSKTLGILPEQEIMKDYNDLLYRKDCPQSFTDGSQEWKAIIKSAGSNGKLYVQLADGSILHYNHGVAQWKWE
jgi:BirA family transcriptional regulator, biotin operon repressor / biotin---[acetyl-CoA-carboxylase] ligase